VSRRRGNRGGGQRGCVLVCEQPRDREVERGMVRRQSVEHLRSRRCGHADAAEGNIHGFEEQTMGLIDVAVAALLVVEPLPCAGAHGDANNQVEADHGRLKARLRPMRGLKQDRCARVIIAGHVFVQNVRRGHYELAVEEPVTRRVAIAFDELAMTI
jgi:hypothetical protein